MFDCGKYDFLSYVMALGTELSCELGSIACFLSRQSRTNQNYVILNWSEMKWGSIVMFDAFLFWPISKIDLDVYLTHVIQGSTT